MQDLEKYQNRDGGWPYRPGGPSWTEPAAYALLALSADRSAGQTVERAVGWLRATQRPDGGWAPMPDVTHSTWVSAVVVLLGPAMLGEASYRRAVGWLLEQTGEETSFLTRLRTFLSGNQMPPEQQFPGSPWFPGASRVGNPYGIIYAGPGQSVSPGTLGYVKPPLSQMGAPRFSYDTPAATVAGTTALRARWVLMHVRIPKPPALHCWRCTASIS